MTFPGPLGGTLFAYVAIGAAVLAIGAYIIKMRRRRFEVPFAQLWRRVLETKDANSLWKQLKRLLSLLLILLILGLILFAALDPTRGEAGGKARSVVILLDASGSMKTMDGDEAGKQSRFDAAKVAAKRFIDSMHSDLTMVMKVDGQATPMSRFTNDAPMLDKVVDGIVASDTPADLTRALGAAADALHDRPNPLIVLISDGAFPEPQLGLVSWTKGEGNLAAVDLSNIDVRYLPVGHRSDNVGIVAFNVRRYIANKAAYEVYIEVQNFGPEMAHRKLELYNGADPVEAGIRIDLTPAGTPGAKIHRIYTKIPANLENKLHATVAHVDGAGGSDAFALDDSAFALLPARKKQKVLMVTEDNLFLEAAMLVYENVDPLKVTPKEYDDKPGVADGMDVVIFDEHTPSVLPPSPTSILYFHPSGENAPFKILREVDDPHITEVDKDHPVMQWVTMGDVHMDRSDVFDIVPKNGDTALARFTNDAVIAARRDGKRKILAFGFSLPSAGRDAGTDLPMRVAFPMLLVNALDWFAGDQTDLLTTYPTGKRQRIPLDGVVGATEAEVKGPDGTITHTPIIDGLATFYGSRVGYYDVTAKGADGKPIAQIELAANLASPEESDIAPSKELTLGGRKLLAPEPSPITTLQKIWVYLILLAAGLILVEWITYHRRITV